MSRSLKQAQAYSRKVLPPLWRNIAVKDDISLQYFGRANLEKMLEEWQILARAYELKLKYYQKNNNLSGAADKIKLAEQDLKNARFGIAKITEILPGAEEKPIFAYHRPLTDYFVKGERAFTVVIEDGYFTPVTILSQEIDVVYVCFDMHPDKPTGSIEYNSPLLLKLNDLVYLMGDLDFARLYACGSDLVYAEDIELFLSMLEDCKNAYFPLEDDETTPFSKNA